MAGQLDVFLLEKQVGREYSKRILSNLKKSIQSKANKDTGLSLKSTVKPIYKNGFLDKLTIYTPYYIYPILHYGFEGSKKNGVNARLKAREFIVDAVENGRLINDLADKIGMSRAENIINKINFKLFDKKTYNKVIRE